MLDSIIKEDKKDAAINMMAPSMQDIDSYRNSTEKSVEQIPQQYTHTNSFIKQMKPKVRNKRIIIKTPKDISPNKDQSQSPKNSQFYHLLSPIQVEQ